MGLETSKKKGQPSKKQPTPMEVKTFIMVAQNKLTLYRNKKVQLIKQKRREVVNSLKENNLDVSKAKMDSIIREEDLITAYDILGPLCEILKEKVTYIMSSDKCPPDIRAPLDTLIYASSRLEVEELHKLNELIGMKYGQAYITQGTNNTDQLVNVNILEKLKVKPASDAFITIRLKQLCKEENLQFDFPCEVIGGNDGFQPGSGEGGDIYNQPGMSMNNPYNAQGSNPYGSQFNVSSHQGGNFNQYDNQQYNPNQNPYGEGGFDNYNKQFANNNQFNPNQGFAPNQNPYENVKMSQQAGNPYENVKMSQQNQKPFGMQQSQQQPYQNFGNQSRINPYSQMQDNIPQKQSVIPQNSQFNQNEFSKPNVQQNNNNIQKQQSQFDPNIFPNTNIQNEIPKNPSQFNPNDFNSKPNDQMNFPKNPSQFNPNDFPKNPSQFNPQDFPKPNANPSQMDFPKNPSQFNPHDFQKPNTNPSQMDFPKNPSQFNPNTNPSHVNLDFPSNPSQFNPHANPSQMDFPKNPSQLGKPGDYPNGSQMMKQDNINSNPNEQMKTSSPYNPYIPGSTPNGSMNIPNQSQIKDNKELQDSFNPYSINEEGNQNPYENKSSVSAKLYKNNPMQGFDVEDDDEQPKKDDLDFP